MEIERKAAADGGIHDTVITTPEEDTVIDAAVDTVMTKHLAAGNKEQPEDRETVEWTVLGLLREGGVEAVQKFAAGYVGKQK